MQMKEHKQLLSCGGIKMNIKQLELIIFDLDGTLVDSEQVYRRGWVEVLKSYGHEVDESVFEVMRGQSTKHNNQIIKNYLGSDQLVQEARGLREAYYFDALEKDTVALKDGAREMILAAYHNGLKIGVATSSYKKRGLATLKRFALAKFFDYMVFGDEVNHAKPHPEIYKKVLEQAGVSVNKSMAVEDSSSGLQSALAAGLTVCFVPEGETSLDGIEGKFKTYTSLNEVQRELF